MSTPILVVCGRVGLLSYTFVQFYQVYHPRTFVSHLQIASTSTSTMIGLPLCPNRRRITQNLTDIPPLHPEIFIQSLPDLPLRTRSSFCTLWLNLRQCIRRPQRPGLGQRPVAEVYKCCLVEHGLRVPASGQAEVWSMVCVSELGGEQGVGALR
jgi:hypothetical protein